MFCKSYFAEQTIFWGAGPNIPSTISYTLQWNVLTEMVTIAIFFHNHPITDQPLIPLICFLYEKYVKYFHLMGIKIITSYDHNYITIQNCLQFMHCPKRNSIILNQNRTQPNPIMVELGKTIYYLCTIPKLKEQNRENQHLLGLSLDCLLDGHIIINYYLVM